MTEKIIGEKCPLCDREVKSVSPYKLSRLHRQGLKIFTDSDICMVAKNQVLLYIIEHK